MDSLCGWLFLERGCGRTEYRMKQQSVPLFAAKTSSPNLKLQTDFVLWRATKPEDDRGKE
jgi:hypothetical protein